MQGQYFSHLSVLTWTFAAGVLVLQGCTCWLDFLTPVWHLKPGWPFFFYLWHQQGLFQTVPDSNLQTKQQPNKQVTLNHLFQFLMLGCEFTCSLWLVGVTLAFYIKAWFSYRFHFRKPQSTFANLSETSAQSTSVCHYDWLQYKECCLSKTSVCFCNEGIFAALCACASEPRGLCTRPSGAFLSQTHSSIHCLSLAV